MCRHLILLLSATGLASCANLDTRLPDISAPDLAAETTRQETDALRQIQSDAFTLLNTGWPILTANAELCPRIRPAIGVKTHTLKSYPKHLRESAGHVLGADETPRIFQIADGSPAALARLKLGDVILDEAGEPAKIENDWEEILADNVVNVRRGEDTLTISVEGVSTCDYDLRLSGSTAINAYADGRHITVTAGMMDFVESDAELALIIGHELGHNTMGHVRKILSNYIISLGGTRYTRPFESEADYVGLYYMVRAGYSAEGVSKFWQRLAKVAPKNISRAKTHPTFPDRFLRIEATQAEIKTKQDAGNKLYPNFLKDDPASDS